MIERNAIVEYQGKLWLVCAMARRPNATVDWYYLIPNNPLLKDPYSEMISVPARLLEQKTLGNGPQNNPS